MAAKETPESMQRIKQALPSIIEQDYGVSRQELFQALQTNPALRSAAFQSMMLDAAKYRMAQREVVNKVDRSVPPVQRPGVSQPRSDDGVTSALNRFRAEPSVENAAKLLQARRANR